GLVGRAVVEWGEQQIALLEPDTSHRLQVRAIEGDEIREALLRDRGYSRGGDGEAYFAHSLDRTISGSALPAGFDVRHVDGEPEWEARVQAHREVWHPSSMTFEAYRRLRTLPGYQPELDLVVTAPDGEIAAYCIVWWDERAGTGEFEPVGTRKKYRGMGLGRSLVGEGLRRLQARGAHSAVVYTPRSNEPAVALYEACGFQVTCEAYLWTDAA
ncbi:MAG TPA: GNAT family N-acetyltransferase, partial [Chloroflexota bacterium]|nr:GNAT family N-acetyltransferase [Chloroflexota bacterium]